MCFSEAQPTSGFRNVIHRSPSAVDATRNPLSRHQTEPPLAASNARPADKEDGLRATRSSSIARTIDFSPLRAVAASRVRSMMSRCALTPNDGLG